MGAMYHSNMKLYSWINRATSIYQNDDFLETIKEIFASVRYIGISNFGLNGFFLWTAIVLISLVTIEIAAFWKIIMQLTGLARNTSDGRGLVGKLSGLIFYGNALLSLILSIKFIASWSNLSHDWFKADCSAGFKLPTDARIRRRMIVVTVFVAICAMVEHILSMMSATGLNCPLEEYFQRYILSSHGFLLQTNDYSLWNGIPIFIMSNVATILWNFQDLIIILISMGLTSRYHRLNIFVKQVIRRERKNIDVKKLGTDTYIHIQVWRRVREAYVCQATLVRMLDSKLGALILLSNINNLYFICLQLFLGIRQVSGELINHVYYFMSLGWLLIRACSVVLAASDIYTHSTMALPCLYKCPESTYNIEIKRLINQLSNDDVALTGMGFFSLNRRLLLQYIKFRQDLHKVMETCVVDPAVLQGSLQFVAILSSL